MIPPDPIPDPGWQPVVPFPNAEGTFLFDADRVRIAYFRKPGDEALFARAWFGPRTLGPPGHVHGGAMAATLDEAMGAVCWMHGHKTVAGEITISFRAMLPIATETTVSARIESIERRKIQVRSTLADLSGRTVAQGQGVFVILREEHLKAIRQTGNQSTR